MYRYPALHNWESMATLGTCTVPYLYVMADDVPDSCGFSGLSSVPVRVTHYTFGRTTDNNRSGRVRNFQDTAVKFTHGHHSHFPTNHTAPASRMDCSPTPAMQQQHMGCNVYEVAFSTTPHVLSSGSLAPARVHRAAAHGRRLVGRSGVTGKHKRDLQHHARMLPTNVI